MSNELDSLATAVKTGTAGASARSRLAVAVDRFERLTGSKQPKVRELLNNLNSIPSGMRSPEEREND